VRYKFPPLNALRVFEAVMRHGSLKHAADELCLTPQAVSQQVKQLESFLETKLFFRSARSIVPTSVALALVERVRAGFDGIAEGLAEAAEMSQVPHVRLHVSPFFATTYLIRNLTYFKAENPDVEFDISIGVEDIDLGAEQHIDALINWSYGETRSDFLHTPLIEDLKAIVAVPELLRAQPIRSPADLLQHSLIAPSRVDTLWRDALALLDVDQAPKTVLAFHTNAAQLEATLAGLGVGLISHFDAKRETEAGRLVAPFGLDLLSQLPLEVCPRFNLVYREEKLQSPIFLKFKAWLLKFLCTDRQLGFPSRFSLPAGAVAEA